MLRKLSLGLVFLLACPRTVTLTQIEVPARLPFTIARDVGQALAKANDLDLDAPRWRVLGGHEAAGYIVEHYRLGRGLHLLLSIDHDAHAFTHQLWFDARDLDPKTSAALIELYRDHPGSKRMRSYELAGARTSAGISRELGFFAATAPTKLGDAAPFESIARLEAERLSVALDPAGAIQRSSRLMDPRALVDQAMLRALRQRTEIGRPEPLTPESLRKTAAETLAAQRLVLVIAGDVDRTEVLSLLRALHASRGTVGDVESKKTEVRTHPPAFAVEVPIPADDRELLLGWTIDPATAGPPLEAAAHVLAAGDPSRLALRLGEGVSGIRARAVEGARTFEVTVILEPTITSTRAAQRVRDEIAAVAKGEGSQAQLERARARMIDDVLGQASGLETRAELFASAFLMSGSVDAIDLRLAELSSLDAAAVSAAVKDHLSTRAPAMVLGVPQKEGGS